MQTHDARNEFLVLDAHFDMASNWTLRAIVSWQDSQEHAGPPIPGSPNYVDVIADSVEWTQELRFIYQSPRGAEAVIGVFHATRGRDEFGVPGTVFEYTAEDDTKTIAAFADATYPLGESLDLLAGIRVEREEQRRDFDAGPFGFGFLFDESHTISLPKLGLRWNITADYSLSVVAYRGYSPRGAGVSFVSFTPYRFDEEVSDNIELVWRSVFPDHRVTVNANIFATRQNEHQLFGAGPLGLIDVIITNAKRTRTLGAEFEVSKLFLSDAELFFSAGVLDAEIVEFGDPVNDAVANGNTLGFAPKFSARFGGTFHPRPDLRL